jgi:Ca2+/H+ antiporter, TMEM165/GDT1 family
MLTAVLADRYGRPLLTAVAAGLAHAAGNLFAATAGDAMAFLLNPNARSLLLAIALLLSGLGGFVRPKPPKRIEGWSLGPLLTPLMGVLVLSLGERTQFFTFALGVRGLPGFAAAGATLGAFSVAFVAAVLGEFGWQRLSFRWVRIVTNLGFVGAGSYIALGALRLL